MALRKIMTEKEPALHKVCRPVTEFNGRLHRLLDDLCDTLEDAGGAGLAAPQAGILRRVAIISPASISAAIYMAVTPVSSSPRSTAHCTGPEPRSAGSRLA